MILKQKFKTLAGAQKRCAFENGVQRKYRFKIEWFVDGVHYPYNELYKMPKEGIKHWQLSKRLAK